MGQKLEGTGLCLHWVERLKGKMVGGKEQEVSREREGGGVEWRREDEEQQRGGGWRQVLKSGCKTGCFVIFVSVELKLCPGYFFIYWLVQLCQTQFFLISSGSLKHHLQSEMTFHSEPRGKTQPMLSRIHRFLSPGDSEMQTLT